MDNLREDFKNWLVRQGTCWEEEDDDDDEFDIDSDCYCFNDIKWKN